MFDVKMSSSDDDGNLIQAGYRYALSLTHNQHDAEDLIQQACLSVFRKKGALIGKPYLFVTIRNAFFDQCRQRGQTTVKSIDSEAEMPTCEVSHTAAVDDRLDIEVMLRCLRPEERELLYLNSVEGYTAAEIGQITGQPRGTVLSLLARAKKKLSTRYTSLEVVRDDK